MSLSFQEQLTKINFSDDLDYDEITQMYLNYCIDLNQGTKNSFNFKEYSPNDLPIIGEFIFQFMQDLEDKPYEDTLIPELIDIYQTTLHDLFTINSIESTCLVLATPIYSKTGNSKKIYETKIKLQFPYCKTSRTFLDGQFRDIIIKKITKSRLHCKFNNEMLHDWDKRLEKTKDSYDIYGSGNSKISKKFSFIGIYGYSHKNEVIKLDPENSGCFECFNDHSIIKYASDDIKGYFSEEIADSNFLLPVFLSIHFPENTLSLHSSHNSLSDTDIEYNDVENPSSFDLCKYFISLLNKKRFKEPYVYDIGRALYNIEEEDNTFNIIKGNEKYLTFWKESIIKISSDFKVEKCDKMWSTFDTNNNITFKTLAYYAKIDNPDKYNEWHSSWIFHKMEESILNTTQQSVAEVFYRYYFINYFYSYNKPNKWYKFQNNLLIEYSSSELIKQLLKLSQEYERLSMEYSMKQAQISSNDRVKKDEYSKKIQKTQKLIEKLGNEPFQKKVIKCAEATNFGIRNFFDILDSNINLVGTSKMIIELTDTKSYFRPGKPEDFISMTTGVSYIKEYNKNHQDIIDTEKYLSEVFTDKDIKNFFKVFLASLLIGSNAEKKLYFFIGDTNGSKSIIQSIINKMMGDYYFDIPDGFFCSKKNGSGPDPQLAQAKNRRVAISSEPSTLTALDGATIKRYTGNDTLYARNCNENGGSFKATFKTIISCNGIPIIEGNDDATLKRLFMIPFASSWYTMEDFEKLDIKVDDYETQLKEGKFIMDMDFEQKNVEKLARGFLWMAVKTYEKYKNEGFTVPESINSYIKNYWERNDDYIQFINETIERAYKIVDCEDCSLEDSCKCKGTSKIKIIDDTKKITVRELFKEFKSFIMNHRPGTKIVNSNEFTRNICSNKRLGKCNRTNIWTGWKFIEKNY
jgi:phage/plasmid-associated DNA primase